MSTYEYVFTSSDRLARLFRACVRSSNELDGYLRDTEYLQPSHFAENRSFMQSNTQQA